MLGIGVDGWATWGFKDDPGALLEYYGATNITGVDRTNLLACKGPVLLHILRSLAWRFFVDELHAWWCLFTGTLSVAVLYAGRGFC